jgi:adenosylcobinamide-phosphate synthase
VYLDVLIIAYFIDKVFGEFSFIKIYKHPVIFMGDFIKWFEKYFYKDSIFRGGVLTFSLLAVVFSITFTIEYFVDNIFILGLLASTGLASKMLYDSVKGVIDDPSTIRYLVSRDTSELSQSDINKAAVETYAENFSDGVIAPLFYLLFFGLSGLFIYKAVNTLDSMIGYRNDRYENFGKVSARVDDILNYIPARITALLIAIFFLSLKAIKEFYRYGKKHESINAGYPISAMGLSLGVSLGGPTSYFGKIKEKAYFGDGKKDITKDDIKKALSFRNRFDAFIFLVSCIFVWSI